MKPIHLLLIMPLIFSINSVNAVRKNRAKKRAFSITEMHKKAVANLDALVGCQLIQSQTIINENSALCERIALYKLQETNNDLAAYLRKAKYLPKILKRHHQKSIEYHKTAVKNCNDYISYTTNLINMKEKMIFAALVLKAGTHQKIADLRVDVDVL